MYLAWDKQLKTLRVTDTVREGRDVVIEESEHLGDIADTLLRIRRDTPKVLNEVLKMMEGDGYAKI